MTLASDRRSLLGLLPATLGLATACLLGLNVHAADSAEHPERRGGTLKAAIHPEPPTMAFFLNGATPIRTVVSKIFDGLVDYGPDLKPRPQLAESWTVSPDGLVMRFNLRKGVRWHDGKPFTAADVKYSVEEVWLKVAPTTRRVFQHLAKVETPDSHTVVLRFSKPAPVAINALNAINAPILPRHLYQGSDINNNPANNVPVGTGPFRFKEWKRGSHILLERNPDYYIAGRPYLDQVVWNVIPDVAGRATALETGAIQYAERNPVTFADADRLAKLPGLVVSKEGYNGFSGWLWLLPNLRDPVLGKLEVRQAIAHAIDRKQLVKVVWGSYAEPATGPVTSQLATFYTKDTQRYDFDPARANQLLDAAGFPKRADGWRMRIDHPFIPFGDDYRRTGEFVRQSLRRVGIDVTLRSQDLPTWTKQVFTDYDFQLASSWGINWLDPQLGVEQHYWSKAQLKGTPWQNASGYASPEADRLLEAAQQETDPAKRRALYQDLQKLAMEDLPLIPLFEFRWFGVWAKNLQGVTDSFNHSQNNFAHVWFDKR